MNLAPEAKTSTTQTEVGESEVTPTVTEEILDSEYKFAYYEKMEPEDLDATTLEKSAIPTEKELEKLISMRKRAAQILEDSFEEDVSLEQSEQTQVDRNALKDRIYRTSKGAARLLLDLGSEDEVSPDQSQKTHIARDTWDYTRLNKKVEAVEEGLDEVN